MFLLKFKTDPTGYYVARAVLFSYCFFFLFFSTPILIARYLHRLKDTFDSKRTTPTGTAIVHSVNNRIMVVNSFVTATAFRPVRSRDNTCENICRVAHTLGLCFFSFFFFIFDKNQWDGAANWFVCFLFSLRYFSYDQTVHIRTSKPFSVFYRYVFEPSSENHDEH